MGQSIFHQENGPNDAKMRPKVGKHVPRMNGNLPELFSFTFQGVETRFLEEQAHFAHFCTNKDFSRSVLSYFSPTVFPELLILNILQWAPYSYKGDFNIFILC